MACFAQVLAKPRKASRQSRPRSLRVPALTLRRVRWERMSFSEPLVCSGTSGRSRTRSSSALLAHSRASSRSRRTKPVRRKMRSKRAQRRPAAWIGISLIRLESGVVIPDQAAHALLRRAVLIGEGLELMHQALGMHPAERMRADGELAGIIAQHHGA